MGKPRDVQPKTSLFLGDSPEALWQQVALPWLRKQGPNAWRQLHPVVVVVPHRTAAFAFKQRALEVNLNLLGVEVWTPPEVRLSLRAQDGETNSHVLSRETLDLVLRLAARSVLQHNPRNRSAAAVVSDPGAFRQVLDRVWETGVEATEIFSPDLHVVIQRAQEVMREAGWQTSQQEGFRLEAEASQRGPAFSASLTLGFTGEDWALLPLLSALIQASSESTVGLYPPTSPGEEADQLWISTLEERFGAYQQLEPTEVAEQAIPDVALHLAKDVSTEARVITAQVATWLAENPDARICVAVPPGAPLGLLLAEEFASLGIPAHSRFGYRRPGMLEDAAWQRWLDYLATPQLTTFLALIEALEPAVVRALAEAGPAGSFDSREVERALEGAYQQVLSEELPVLASWIEDSVQLSERSRLTSKLLRQLSALPGEGELQLLWDSFVQQAQKLGWYERVELLQPRLDDVIERGGTWLLRSSDFLSWLQALNETREFSRPAETHHYYAKVHLLTPREAAGQSWTHLHVAGLTEGVSPPVVQEDAFLSRRESLEWRRQLRAQFRRLVREGKQGEGQEVLPPGYTWPAEMEAALTRARRAFLACWAMREEQGTVLACSAHLGEETRPSLPLLPSEFFLQAVRETKSEHFPRGGLEEKACRKLAQRSEAWAKVILGDLDQLEEKARSTAHLEAYRQRRAGEEYSPYEFTLQPGSTPPRPLRLSCREWERALQAPATAFLQYLLGVAPRIEFTTDAFNARSRGVWTHQWLGALVSRPRDLPKGEWPPLVCFPDQVQRDDVLRRKARDFRDRVDEAWLQANQPLPAWWLARWEQALGLTLDLAVSWEQVENLDHAATEWLLSERPLALGEGQNLWLRGRVDTLLADASDWRKASRLLILDYKTGTRSEFRVSKMLRDAGGVQLALYALLLSEMAKAEVTVAMVSPRDGLSEVVGTDVLEELESAWRELVYLQNTGSFGWRHPLRDAFQSTETLPLATLSIPDKVGKRKWQQRHPTWGRLA